MVFLTLLDSRPGTEADLNDPLARPRIPFEILFAVGGWSAGSPTSFVETYDTRYISLSFNSTNHFHKIIIIP